MDKPQVSYGIGQYVDILCVVTEPARELCRLSRPGLAQIIEHDAAMFGYKGLQFASIPNLVPVYIGQIFKFLLMLPEHGSHELNPRMAYASLAAANSSPSIVFVASHRRISLRSNA